VSNSYTATPGIVAGALTVNGPITSLSDAGIRIGAAAPFVRLYKRATPGGGLTYNIGTDDATTDSAIVAAHGFFSDNSNDSPALKRIAPTNSVAVTLLDSTLAQDGTLVTNTGNVAENTTRTKLIPGNTLGANGSLILEWMLNGQVQGGVATTFRVRIGGTQLFSFSKAATSTMLLRLLVANANATNAQRGIAYLGDTVVAFTAFQFTGAFDTTLDQTVTLTIQSGATTDNWQDWGYKIHAFGGRTSPL